MVDQSDSRVKSDAHWIADQLPQQSVPSGGLFPLNLFHVELYIMTHTLASASIDHTV